MYLLTQTKRTVMKPYCDSYCSAGVPPATGQLAGGTPALRTAFLQHVHPVGSL